jgi:hypothetical protein
VAFRAAVVCRVGKGVARARIIFGGHGAVPTFGGEHVCDADVGTAP